MFRRKRPHPGDPPHGPWGMRPLALSQLFALAGGTLILSLVAISLISIVWYKPFSMPVPGDLEIMLMGSAVASATFTLYLLGCSRISAVGNQ